MVNLCFQDNAFMLNLNLNFTVFARSWAIHPVGGCTRSNWLLKAKVDKTCLLLVLCFY